MYRIMGRFLQDSTYSMYRTTGGFLQDGTVQYVVRMVVGTLYILQLPHPGLDSGWKLKQAIRTKMDLGSRIYRGGERGNRSKLAIILQTSSDIFLLLRVYLTGKGTGMI
jgi:hypothetical protein